MKDDLSPKNIIERCSAPTPRFFRKLRRIMLGVGAAGGALLAFPAAFPAAIVGAAYYMVAVGVVGGALTTLPKEDHPEDNSEGGN